MRALPANADLLGRRGPGTEVLPTRVTGTLEGVGRGEYRDVAVAMNGRVYATGRTFHLHGRPARVLLAAGARESLHPGDNRLEIFEVGAGARTGSRASPELRARAVGQGARVLDHLGGFFFVSMNQHQKLRRSSWAMQVRK